MFSLKSVSIFFSETRMNIRILIFMMFNTKSEKIENFDDFEILRDISFEQ